MKEDQILKERRVDLNRRWFKLREEKRIATFSRRKEILKELRILLQEDAALLKEELSLRTY